MTPFFWLQHGKYSIVLFALSDALTKYGCREKCRYENAAFAYAVTKEEGPYNWSAELHGLSSCPAAVYITPLGLYPRGLDTSLCMALPAA